MCKCKSFTLLIDTYTIYTLHIHTIYPLHAQHYKKKPTQKSQPTNKQETKKVKTKASLSSSNLFFIHLMPMHTLSSLSISLSLSLCDLTQEPAWDCKSISSSVQYVTLQNIYTYIYICIYVFLTSKFSYLLFLNPTHQTIKTGS